MAVKLQLARFEVFGAAGWATMAEVAEHARGLGLLVIADGKRGDIDVSARAYAQRAHRRRRDPVRAAFRGWPPTS